jgi:hypothetical protein
MTATNVCPECGKPLSSDAPQGLCPECLLKAALPGQSALESAATAVHHRSPATVSSPEAGVRVKYFGDYELLEEIARGGMGVVWKARQTSLKRDVALKMIRAGALAGPEEVQRFLREAEAAANLQHPNIVAIHEVGEHDGRHYFSMDYVAGRDLGALVQDGPLPAPVAARYVKVIAEAIHFAHQRGTLHRDLKPQNVLIDAAGQPRITDFGLAKIVEDDSRLTQPGAVMGSPSYMPPEQAAGRTGDVGPASDVYSLGAMLYELLTGRPPFRAATAMATLHEVMEAEPAAPHRLKADIPADLETVCLRCLEKSPSARYPTARALAEDLDRYLQGEPIQARPASPVRKAVSWVRRHPGTLAALAAFVMVALSVGIYYLFEENAFLRAQQADPTLTRVPGPVHESLQVWEAINPLAMCAGIYTLIFLMVRTRGLSLKDWRNGAWAARPAVQPLGDRTRAVALGMGLAVVGCGIGFLAIAIQAHVWEGESIWMQLLGTYASVYFGLAILGLVVRDYRRALYGTPSRQLTAEQVASIRWAMEDFDMVAAVKLYRAAVPDAGLMEANQYVLRLAESERAKHPGKFVPPPLSLTGLNWIAMLICAAVEAVILGVFWAVMPPSHPVWFAAEFACALLLGMGLLAGGRVKGFWKRLLLLVPAVAATVLAEGIRWYSADASARSAAAYLLGFFAGIFLMISGFTRRRRQS